MPALEPAQKQVLPLLVELLFALPPRLMVTHPLLLDLLALQRDLMRANGHHWLLQGPLIDRMAALRQLVI